MRGLEDLRFWIDSTDKSGGLYHQEIHRSRTASWLNLKKNDFSDQQGSIGSWASRNQVFSPRTLSPDRFSAFREMQKVDRLLQD